MVVAPGHDAKRIRPVRRRVVHYADYGIVEELAVASQRGTENHARARVVSRTTAGAKFRLHFFRRLAFRLAADKGVVDEDSAPRSLLGVDYATTPDGSEHLDKSDGEAQVLNRWDVGILLCRVEIRMSGGTPICALAKESQRRVGAILTELDSGTSIDSAFEKAFGEDSEAPESL